MHQKGAGTEFHHLLRSKKRSHRTRDASKAGRSFSSETCGGEEQQKTWETEAAEGSVGEQDGVVEQPPEICLQINIKTWEKVCLVIKTARLHLCRQINIHLM